MLVGVCEGFYGKPWSTGQRQELFVRMARFGMTTYLYAPKDDYKHRLHWRKLYTKREAAELRVLITAAQKNAVDFVYAISPGLDMMFSDKQDIDCLKTKLNQVASLGCRDFALLFDDIDADLCSDDQDVYDSVGHAQAALTNMLYMDLGQPKVFLFCPTEYCNSRANPDLLSSEYLKTIGEILYQGIKIMWTGSKVVPRRMTVESLIEVKKVLQRPPVIWENLHANDYDQTRLYLGPYTGRPCALAEHLGGVLTNPNCEFHANFVAMHTLAQWSRNTVTRFPPKAVGKDATDETAMELDTPLTNLKSGDGGDGGNGENSSSLPYLPHRALRCAVQDWIPEFYRPRLSDSDGWSGSGGEPEAEAEAEAEESVANSDMGEKDDDTNNYSGEVGVASGGGATCDDNSMDISSSNDAPPLKTKTRLGRRSCNKNPPPAAAAAAAAPAPAPAAAAAAGRRSKLEELERLDEEDLLLLCHLHYLPFEHGPRGAGFLKEASWLIDNAHTLKDEEGGGGCGGYRGAGRGGGAGGKGKPLKHKEELSDKVKEWYDRATSFHVAFKDVLLLIDKLLNAPNRHLLYELYHYVSDMRAVLSLVNSYIKWNGLDRPNKEPFRGGGEPEPWTMRGGLHAEFRRLLPVEGQHDLFPLKKRLSKPAAIVTCRPYFPEDQEAVYLVCRRTCDDRKDGSDMFPDYPDLLADDSIGGLLDAYPELCFVCEDEAGRVCGYAVACADIRDYQRRLVDSWLPRMRDKYPDPCPDKHTGLTTQEEAIKTFYNEPCSIPAQLEVDFPAFLHLRLMPPPTQCCDNNDSTPTAAATATSPPRVTRSRTASSAEKSADSSQPPQPLPPGSATDLAARLFECVSRSLRARGVRGVHTAVHAAHTRTTRVYVLRLGFEDVTDSGMAAGLLLLGKKLY